ncbi:hypothetical protein TPHA_0A00980 [Tetrapisispora phaffii CBS 4417]|uniref:Uncharacterized protein n=1 Tax=Tetrapisispora phaffii (strain ATCC 24235 / CBS 4417 / NBRC 1672 / NRRL Y-8282 / UCD 70-5) TaxID=1071381 RepID=G8BMQ5_TETPH|nr:hypothetical protein TPHA_0A00980 [Tetrapisispora phaffii CBS 4417]CCE61183.1 hypothetical protein TPHA_0A00980 [Tetrapisispora phaffii CBS 4417]
MFCIQRFAKAIAIPKMTRPLYYDIGFNITDQMYKGIYNGSAKHESDLACVLERAQARGVGAALITGSSVSESKDAIALINKYRNPEVAMNLYYTVGVHPCSVNEFGQDAYSTMDNPTHDEAHNESLYEGVIMADSELHSIAKARLAELYNLYAEVLKDTNFRAVGEIGMDYDRLYYSSKDMQKLFFEEQLKLSCLPGLAQKPLFLHMRNCCDDFIQILSKFIDGFIDTADYFNIKGLVKTNNDIHYKFDATRKFVVHSFTGSLSDMDRILQLSSNAFIGMNGASLRDEENIKCAELVPIERLLIETDAPWCSIRPTHASYRYLQAPDKVTSAIYVSPFKSVKKEKVPKLNEDELKVTMVKGRNEPCTMEEVAIVISNVKNLTLDEFNKIVWETSCNVYGH